MSTALKRALWGLCCLLSALLCILFLPLSPLSLSIALLLLLITGVLVWRRIGHRARQWAQGQPVSELLSALPNGGFRLPVVLVTGEGAQPLFNGEPLRVTEQGCFIPAPDLSELDKLVQVILTVRPDWHSQFSVLFALFAEQQNDPPVLCGQLRELRYQLARLNDLTGRRTPLLMAGWLNGDDSPWFELRGGETLTTVWSQDHSSLALSTWLAEKNGREGRARLAQSVIVDAWQQWLSDEVLSFCHNPDEVSPPCQPLAIALRFLPLTVEKNSLWAQWLQTRTTLSRVSFSTDAGQSIAQPFPDALLRLLPRNTGYTPRLRALAFSIGIVTLFAALATVASGWNNYWLIRHIGNDIRQFDAIAVDNYEPRTEAWLLLKSHAGKLESWQRNGAPLRLSLWLYQGARIYPPLMAAINRYTPPPEPVVEEKPQEAPPQTVRLPGMSLFDPGQSRLKAGSTKLLVDALVNIKAKPGWLILVAGHTDSTGESVKNQALSLARAEAVRDWMLQTSNIPAGCFALQGYGAEQPVQSNTTPEGRSANRRVEISLVPDVDATCKVVSEPTPATSTSSPREAILRQQQE